jgi:hypothetical protein
MFKLTFFFFFFFFGWSLVIGGRLLLFCLGGSRFFILLNLRLHARDFPNLADLKIDIEFNVFGYHVLAGELSYSVSELNIGMTRDPTVLT